MKFSIESIESSSRATFDLVVGRRDPQPVKEDETPADGEPVGFRIVGPASDEYARAEREIQALNVRESARRRALLDLETAEGAQQVADGADARRHIVIKHCVVDWFGFTLGENEVASFTAENLQRVLKARPNWVRRIVSNIEDEANFIEG